MWIWSHRLQVMLGGWAKKELNFPSWEDARFWNNEKCNHLDGLLFTIIQILYLITWWPRWLPACWRGITILSVMRKPVANIYSCFLLLLRSSCESCGRRSRARSKSVRVVSAVFTHIAPRRQGFLKGGWTTLSSWGLSEGRVLVFTQQAGGSSAVESFTTPALYSLSHTAGRWS